LTTAAVDPPRIVLDTNVGLALFAYRDPGCVALAAALRGGRLQAVANVATRAEWQRVLRRDELRLDAATRDHAAQAFDAQVCDATAGRVPLPTSACLPRCRDPDDQMFLELARDAGAIALYSRDRELLKLSRRTQRMAGFAVLRPEDHRD
jgi:predicted nucleic acid-binding protein